MATFYTVYKGKGRGKKAAGYRITSKDKRSFYLGANLYSEEIAQDCRLILNEIERFQALGEPFAPELIRRIEGRPDFKKRLAGKGFIDLAAEIIVGELLARYFRENVDGLKPTTQSGKASTRKRFLSFFNADRRADSIDADDARAFGEWLETTANDGAPYKEATRAGTIRDARAVWNWAIKKGVVKSNPFNEIKRGSYMNKERLHYIPLEHYKRLLAACPSQEWRAIVALCRIGGLRNPSETLATRWEDVNFETGRLVVRASKTNNVREIPLFPSLRKELESLRRERDADDKRDPVNASPFVVVRYRGTAQNMRTTFEKIVFRAGLDSWERLFQNLRASAATDIAREYGATVEAFWVGHSEKTSSDHYQQIPDNVWKAAANEKEADSKPSRKRPPKNDE